MSDHQHRCSKSIYTGINVHNLKIWVPTLPELKIGPKLWVHNNAHIITMFLLPNLSNYLFQVLPVSIKILRESLKLNFRKCNLINIKNGAIVVAWMFRNFLLMHLCQPRQEALFIFPIHSATNSTPFMGVISFFGWWGLYSKYQHDDCDFQQRLASSDRGGHHYKYIIQINIWSLINI